MISKTSVLKEFERKQRGELVLTGQLYREKFSNIMSETAFAQAVSRLCSSGEIVRVSKGIYCRPKITRFGTVLPSEQEIVEMFITGNKGVIVGYGLYNALGITTQISKRQTIFSSNTEDQLKRIGNITIRKYDLKYTSDVKSMICMMELLHHYKEIQDINISALIRCTERLANEYNDETFERVQRVIGYPKWTIAFLREVLNFHRIPNQLNRYLSALTNYPIPTMQDLYEIARQQS